MSQPEIKEFKSFLEDVLKTVSKEYLNNDKFKSSLKFKSNSLNLEFNLEKK